MTIDMTDHARSASQVLDAVSPQVDFLLSEVKRGVTLGAQSTALLVEVAKAHAMLAQVQQQQLATLVALAHVELSPEVTPTDGGVEAWNTLFEPTPQPDRAGLTRWPLKAGIAELLGVER